MKHNYFKSNQCEEMARNLWVYLYTQMGVKSAKSMSAGSEAEGRKTEGRASNEHPLSIHSASIEHPLQGRGKAVKMPLHFLRYAAVLFAVLVMSMANVGTAWADNVTISAAEMVEGDTKSHITPDAGAEAAVSEQVVWLDGSTKKKYDCLQLSSASGTGDVLSAVKEKSVFFSVDNGYKITGFTVSGASNKDASTTAPIVMACWTGDVSRTPALIAQITLPHRQTSSLPSVAASSIPAGTKIIALYRQVKVDNTTTPTELVASSGSNYGSGNTGNIVSVTITYEAAASSCTARTFKSGEKIYFKDQESNFDFDALWKVSSGNVYAYFWNDDESEKDWSSYGSPVEGEWNAANTIYELTVPGSGKEYTHVLFTRGNNNTCFDCGSTWDKTTNQEPCEGKNLFYVEKGKYADHIYYGHWGNFTPAGKTVYFDNRNVSTWTTAYVRIGHGSNNSAWGAMTKVAGTKYLYSQSTSKYASHTDFAIANKAGWTGSNHIDQPEKTYSDGSWSGSEHKMTKQTNFQQYAIENDVYLCPKATSVLEHECQFYQVTNTNSTTSSRIDANTIGMRLPSYTVTSTFSNCAIAMVKYTADDGSTTESLPSGGTVKPSQYVKATVTPSTGYKFSAVTLSGTENTDYTIETAAAAGTPGVYSILGNVTINAVCVAKQCTITFDKNGGSSGSNGTTGTYAQAMTTITPPTRDGYIFDGYWDSETSNDGSGNKYYNADGTSAAAWNKDTESATTLYAKWNCVTPTFGTNLSTSQVDYDKDASASALTVAATAGGGTVTYQWYSNDENNTTTPITLTNCTTATYTPLTSSVGTTYYYCVATNSTAGCSTTTTSNIAKIVVSAAATYSVTYNANNGSATGSVPTDDKSYTTSDSVVVKVPGDLALSNYTFVGWNTKSDGSGTYASPGARIKMSGDLNLYAVWQSASSCPGSSGGTVFALTMKTNTNSNKDLGLGESVLLGTTYATTLTGGNVAFTDVATRTGDARNSAKAQLKKGGSGNKDKIYFGGNDAMMTIYLDCALEEGDVITYTGGDTELSFTTTPVYGNSIYTTSKSCTIPEASALIGKKIIYCWRKTTTSFSVTDITITRPASNYTGLSVEKDPAAGSATDPTISATSVAVGSGVTVTAGAAAAGYVFTGWTSENGTFANASSLSTTFTPNANNAVATAHYTATKTIVIKIKNDENKDGWVIQGKTTYPADQSANIIKDGDWVVMTFSNVYAVSNIDLAYSGGDWDYLNTSTKITDDACYNWDGTERDCCLPLSAPTSLTCSEHTSSSLTFTWTKAANASTYTATLYSDAGCTSQVASQDLGNVATVTFSTLSAETTYYCKVQSHGDGSTYCADGGTTAAQSGTTDAVPAGYTVTYKYNGATSGATPTSETGTSVTLPTPTRTGYVLDGWYTTAGEKVEDGGETYVPEADITLYARWQEACDAEGVAKSTTDVVATGYTAYQEKGGDKVVFTDAPTLGFKYKNAAGNTINNSTTAVVRNNAYKCQISSDSGNKGSIKTNSTFSNVDSISFYFAASDKGGCKIAVWCSTDDFSADSTQLLSATTYADNNSEFKLKTLAIPSGKKASALTFKFRFTVTSSGKTSYIDSLKVYSSTSGGGTCYHVYYHGNGAESGYVNDTVSYTAGSKATVLNYNYGRYPLAKTGYDFRGWATSASGAVAYSAGQKIDITSADVDLYAVWAPASSALVTWEKKVNVATWTDNTTPSTTNPTNIGTIGSSATLIASPGATSGKTPQIQLASGASNADKGASFTFSMKSADKVVVPTKVSCEVANVGGESNGDITYKAVLTDGAGNTYYSTNSICPNNNGTLNPIDFVFSSGLSLRGDITVKVYAWLSGSGSGFSFRMGPDIKFYGTVEDYVCADPSAPTISGVSEYVPGETITLTASHDGENYDNLTTYTWYKGADWTTASGTTPVQAAATGESGYTLTIADCTTGNAGKYWCKVSNGTGCDAHNSEGYDVTVYPTYTITYNLNGGDWGEVEHKDSYTQFDEDYTLPIPTKTGYVFAGWYGASDFSGLPTVVLGAGSVGNKEYYAKWGAVVTVSWTVDDDLYRGGGDYSVKAVIDQTTWDESYKDQLELTATEGVTLKNIVASVVSSHVQVTADFDITTGLAADATEITFTLSVPANGTYGPKVDEHSETLTSCAGSSTTITIFDGATMSDKTDADDISYKSGTEYTDGTTGFKYKCAGFKKDLVDVTEYTNHGSYRNAMKYGGNSTSYYISMTIPTGYTGSMEIVYGSTEKTKYFAFGTSNSSTANGSNGTKWNATTAAATTLYSATIDDLAAGTYYLLATGDKAIVAKIAMTLYATGGGITPTLTWDDGDADIANDGVSKSTSNDDFVYTASQNKNSLGAITYSSSDATVATVNATTGQVHLVGAAGTATITATIAASGCFSSANVSYTITVTDDCDDEAGTIETEDLGCSGVKMTVTGHTAATGVIYQWYKVGTPSDTPVGTGQDNFTATEAGSYYVIVTNTGDRHCAKRSTNTVTVEAQAAATVTKIVDSWYVKKDRRTPDIELVKTTNATSFTVKIGSTVIWNSDSTNTTGFAGCGFHMGENGIIYLNGTKDNGDAPAHDDGTWAAGDETLTITAIGCGGNASQNITIHRQAATNYKEIAFVADGGKGMKKDSITVGHGDGTELYEYLDSVTVAGNRLFQLSERNIYWTTDEKAIREEYSQFDAILITDDPSTNTVVKTGDDYKTKGYVNAFGTMVDVRPIFTMEAYVSALKNWGSKGIKGNPQSPNPRQYEMRLECKDHEIYGSGLPNPEDGTNVWEEVIGGETFRHVILVDSTKGVYKGVAYNAQTAGKEKPALQGFTGEAAGSLLGLGRISNGSLQAAIERQEEPAARLLVMGINAKALQPTCALTNEGKVVIRNILTYLLKTNMEEVDDCSNYFTGEIDSDWNKAGNWSKDALPSSEAKVRILAPCVISGVQPHVAQVAIVSSGESGIRGSHRSGEKTCNGKLTINANGALIVGGKVLAAEAPHFAANDLKPTTPEDLVINTDGSNQAALIFDNEEAETQATVNLYSLGRIVSSTYQFQYMAVPMEVVPVNPSFANETHNGTMILTYVWNENGGWERRGYYEDLRAFECVGITTGSTLPMNYTMRGNLASTSQKEIALTNGSGAKYANNIIGNSWTAPIDIASLKEAIGDDSNVQKTVYIYCTGNDGDEGAHYGTSGDAGQWLAVPIDASGWSGWSGLKVIPAMQAFLIRVNAETSLELNYNDVVRKTATENLNEPLRAPRRAAADKDITMTTIHVADSKTYADLRLFEGKRFDEEFDNGWEAEYLPCDGRTATLYAETEAGQMAVAALSELEGTVLGFAPGKETEYTFTFLGGNGEYYLNDLKLKNSTLMSAENSYVFTFEEGDTNRFYISRTAINAPEVATGMENLDAAAPRAQKIIYNDKLYIIRGGRLYDATGKVVK